MSYLTLVSGLLGLVGLAFAAKGFQYLFKRRLLRALGLEMTGGMILLLASSAFLLASNLHTYQRLVYERPVAEISFQQQADQVYRVDIASLDSDYTTSVELLGDEWQLDTQVLTWRGVATLFGLDANYRLHRIAGRYNDIEQERHGPRSVHNLVPANPLTEKDYFDLWQLANQHQDWLRWVDAVYGSAVFLPMTDGAKFKVAITRTGLVARPDNKIARQAVSHWIGL
jgi:hypothetical protein